MHQVRGAELGRTRLTEFGRGVEAGKGGLVMVVGIKCGGKHHQSPKRGGGWLDGAVQRLQGS